MLRRPVHDRRWTAVIALLPALLPASGCAGPRSELAVSNVHTVAPGVLIRGAQTDEAGLIALRRAYGVGTIVNFNDRTSDSEALTAKRLGFRYVALPADPFEPRQDQIIAFLKVVRDGDHSPVYIHCKDGMDRTGVAVAAYRVLIDGWSAADANRELRSYQTWPHAVLFQNIPGFVRSVESDRSSWLAMLAPTATGPTQSHLHKEFP